MRTKPAADDARGTVRPDGKAIQQMFAAIAPRYDFLNHFLSASIDRRWRRLAAAKVGEHLRGKNRVCLDLCTGTGDLALELHRRLGASVIAADFCHPMLVRSLEKSRNSGFENSVRIVEADSMATPFGGDAFDAVTIAFGLRNLEDHGLGLGEMRRVLKQGGILVVLEFSRPVVPLLRQSFQFYFHKVLPRLGAWVSGHDAAYRYLPDSVGRFPAQKELAGLMEGLGYRNVGYRNLSGGIAALHWGTK